MSIVLKSNEVELSLSPFGASMVELKTKDNNGNFRNILLTHKDEETYANGNPSCLGATCGRVVGRIENGKFTLDGTTYKLTKNFKDTHTLHGGNKNFTKSKWDYELSSEGDKSICTFTLNSNHLDEGFPADVKVTVQYVLEGNALTVNYYAIPDRKTYLNLTNHSYFNLSNNDDTIYNHTLQVNGNEFCLMDDLGIPTSVASVKNTDFDFTNPMKIGNLFEKTHESMKKFKGFDHVYLLDKSKDFILHLQDENSGRSLRVESPYPALVLYTYNSAKETNEFLDRKNVAHSGIAIEPHYGVNAMNNDIFNIPVVDSTNHYSNSIKYIFNENII